jgi:predicted metalloprotease with PDZ domain
MPISLTYRLSLPAPATHLVHVEMTIAQSDGPVGGRSAADGSRPLPPLAVFMAAWTPGSYLVREFARHVEGLFAEAPATVTKIRKNAWRLDAGGAARAVLRYRVYAGELTVRTSHVDEAHAFLTGAAIFLGVEGELGAPATLEIALPVGWRAVTSLPKEPSADPRLARFTAPDFDALVDSPIELGAPLEESFEVLGKPHRLAVCPAGGVPRPEALRLVEDAKAIVKTEARLFGDALPYDAYELLLHLSTRARGGLEHRSSAALIASPACFATREGYLDLLSLVAHELFHVWNVKRIRPAGLSPYRYDAECYTRSLWWFEGGTSYYDWRVLALAQLCTVDEYLDHLAAEISYLDQTPGRLVHPLTEASFDAWIKLYRPDENSTNSSVSYYRKGEVVCALLDLELRARSAGRSSLDAVLGELWKQHGVGETPVPEDGLLPFFERVSGVGLRDLFEAWIHTASEIDYARPLAHVGLTLERSSRPEAPAASLSVRVRADGSRVVVTSSTRDGAAWRAGIDAGDELLSIAGSRVEGTNLEPILRGRLPGEPVAVLLARDGRVVPKTATLDAARPDRVKIVPQREATAAAREAFAAWLGAPHPAARKAGA